MAQRRVDGQDGNPAPTQSPVPVRPDSVRPALQAAVVDTPVTPGTRPGSYDSIAENASSPPAASFFAELARQEEPGSIGEAAPEAESNQEILRRISLSGDPRRRDSLDEIDPRATNPSLGLSGGIISATFCIPHSLQYTKGSEWVCSASSPMALYADFILEIEGSTWHVCPLRLSRPPLLR
jgi:trehalose 6-phosphate synthase/phosphatase